MKKLFLTALTVFGFLAMGTTSAQSCCTTSQQNCKPKTCCPAAQAGCDADTKSVKTVEAKQTVKTVSNRKATTQKMKATKNNVAIIEPKKLD